MGDFLSEIDLKALWRELDLYAEELDKESDSLSQVWSHMLDAKERYERQAASLSGEVEFMFKDSDSEIILNVGGQIFETNVSVLTRDPSSILAACCRVTPHPLLCPNEETGMIYFDRDWWLFRHVIAFLRSNVLPNNLDTLKELYVEASFYRLGILQKAIEDFPIESVTTTHLPP